MVQAEHTNPTSRTPEPQEQVGEPIALTKATELTLTPEGRHWRSGPDLGTEGTQQMLATASGLRGLLRQYPEPLNPHPVSSMAKVALGSAMSVGPCCLYLKKACLWKSYLCVPHIP